MYLLMAQQVDSMKVSCSRSRLIRGGGISALDAGGGNKGCGEVGGSLVLQFAYVISGLA